MPVTKTAKRALRGSLKKKAVNDKLMTRFEIAIKQAKKSKSQKDIDAAYSMADRAAKKKIIHKNKAARIKSQLSKLLSKKRTALKRSSKATKKPQKNK